LALILTAGVSGCKDDTEDSNGFDTGLPTDKKLSDLSDDDVYKSCVASVEFTNEIMSDPIMTCKIQGLTITGMAYAQAGDLMSDSLIQQTCKTTYQGCLEDPPKPDTSDPAAECKGSSASDIPENCDATVGELEDCTNDYAETMQDSIDEQIPDCEELDQATMDELLEKYQDVDSDSLNDPDDMDGLIEQPAPPASCIAAEKKCPGLIDSLSSDAEELAQAGTKPPANM
jgi:hypothetical protein